MTRRDLFGILAGAALVPAPKLSAIAPDPKLPSVTNISAFVQYCWHDWDYPNCVSMFIEASFQEPDSPLYSGCKFCVWLPETCVHLELADLPKGQTRFRSDIHSVRLGREILHAYFLSYSDSLMRKQVTPERYIPLVIESPFKETFTLRRTT